MPELLGNGPLNGIKEATPNNRKEKKNYEQNFSKEDIFREKFFERELLQKIQR